MAKFQRAPRNKQGSRKDEKVKREAIPRINENAKTPRNFAVRNSARHVIA